MLPSHLSRMLSVCINGDYADATVRQRIKSQCIPYLSQHRREVLAGSFKGRHIRPCGFVQKMMEKARIIRQALAYAHQRLIASEPANNVISFQAAAQRRASMYTATA